MKMNYKIDLVENGCLDAVVNGLRVSLPTDPGLYRFQKDGVYVHMSHGARENMPMHAINEASFMFMPQLSSDE
ncbi:MAG: hypothetical protein K0Q74_701 [Gammaproteobacteria bacterium]|jgi:hypothetical protein|nr:hypothetical protein [Gammaproteobacteria bacterium]